MKIQKGFNDIMLDIAGWIMIGLSIYKIFGIEDATVVKIIPYGIIAALGVVFVAFTIKKVGSKALDTLTSLIKKKTNNEEHTK